MKISVITGRVAVPLLMILIMVFSGCNQLVDDLAANCGNHQNYVNSDMSKIRLVYTVVEGDQRTLIFEDMTAPEDICPELHVTAECAVYWKYKEADTEPFIIKGLASWGPSFERKGLMEAAFDSHGDIYAHSVAHQIGLKQAFGDKPAWLALQIEVKFKSQGDRAVDSAYFMQNVSYLTFRLDHYTYKPKS